MTNFIMMIATGFYSGYLPKAPGTWGSLLAIPIYLLLAALTPRQYLLALAAIIILAIITAGGAEKIIDRKDPGVIVIDEIAGMLITLIGAPNHWLVLLLGFGLFRFFDIVKPFPIRWVDRHINGGFGIVLDDCIAGLFAMLILQAVITFLPVTSRL